MKKIEEIESRIEEIISDSKETGEPTYKIAQKLADKRIMNRRSDLAKNKA